VADSFQFSNTNYSFVSGREFFMSRVAMSFSRSLRHGVKIISFVRFQVLMAASMMFRIVFWDVLPCKMIVD
jgi:hypothetical protein